MTKKHTFEDFKVGQQIRGRRRYKTDRDSAIAFAREYDPQPQHTGDAGVKESIFGEVVVSGWQTAAISMRLKTETELFSAAEGVVGVGMEMVKWARPVYPGDELHIIITILDMRLSKSRADRGVVKYKMETLNQKDEIVMELIITILMPLRGTKR